MTLNRPRPSAPELSGSLRWLNCEPQSLAGSRGRAVALAFWSGGSVLSHNLLQSLARIQMRFPDALRIIAVHTPKFDAERDPALASAAVSRLGLAYPSAHDPAFETWQAYRIQAWPSLALIDGQGGLMEVIAGDVPLESLSATVEALIGHNAPTALASPRPRLRDSAANRPLRFPQGIALSDRYLYVADSGHHRVLECGHDGRVLRQFGVGAPSLYDGVGQDAAFQHPTALALLGPDLFVADTGNHALRRIRLLSGEVTTIAGNGLAGEPGPAPAVPGSATLNAPLGLAGAHDHLYVATAGDNRIWDYEPGRARLRCLAGSGRLGLVDGAAAQASFAHPAGMALIQHALYICDSASSALRRLQVRTGQVQTLIGRGLFEFGDRDGDPGQALLQFPLSVAKVPKRAALWLADAYNDSIKQLKPGGGPVQRMQFDHPLQQPCALATGAGAVWLANCNAHEILRIVPESGAVSVIPVAE